MKIDLAGDIQAQGPSRLGVASMATPCTSVRKGLTRLLDASIEHAIT